MAWNSCNVVLNKGVNEYFSGGDLVTGTITFLFKNPQTLQDIEFRAIGICKAHWTRPASTVPYIKIYSGEKKVLDVNLNIFDHLIGKTVNIGVECLPFQFVLPADLPSTFKSSLAQVNYFLKLECKSKNKIFKTKKVVPFIVLGKVNLNHLEEFVTPSFYQINKKFRLRGKFTMCLKTFKGFAPMQNVPFDVTLCNEEKVKFDKIRIDLIQKVKYTVSSGYVNEENKICKVDFKINSNQSKQICKFSMDIPKILPTSINVEDPMVEIIYFFRVEVTFPYHFARYEDIPVTVATEPLFYYDCDVDKDLTQ